MSRSVTRTHHAAGLAIGLALLSGCVLLHGDPAATSSTDGGSGAQGGGDGGVGGDGGTAGQGGVGGDPVGELLASLDPERICSAADAPSTCVQAVAIGQAGPVATRGDVVRFIAGNKVLDSEGEVVATTPEGMALYGPDLHTDLFGGSLCISSKRLTKVVLCEDSSCKEGEPTNAGGWGGCAWDGQDPPLPYAVRANAGGTELLPLDASDSIFFDGPATPTQLVRGADGGFLWSYDNMVAPIVRWSGAEVPEAQTVEENFITGLVERTKGTIYARGRTASTQDGPRILYRHAEGDSDSNAQVKDGDGFARVVETKESVFADGVVSGKEQLWECTKELSECQSKSDPLQDLPTEYQRAEAFAGLAADNAVYYTVEVQGLVTLTVLVRHQQ